MKKIIVLLFVSFVSLSCFAQQVIRTKPGMVKFYLLKGTYSLEELYNPNLTLGEGKLGFVKSNQQLEVVAIDTLKYNFYKVNYKGKLAYIHRNSIVDNSILNKIDPEIRELYRDVILNKEVCLGMNAHEVECSFGVPDDKNRTVTSEVTHEQWVYGNGNVLVYFDNGIVTSFQD